MGKKRQINEGAWIAMHQAVPGLPVPLRERNLREFLPDKQEVFFDRLGQTFNIRLACEHAGVSTSTVDKWRKYNAEFSERFDEALLRAYLDVKMRMLAIAVDGARRKSTIVRQDEHIIAINVLDDAPAHVMSVMRFQLEEIAAIRKAQAREAAALAEPTEEQLVQWLRDDLDAIEATMTMVDDADDADDADALGDEDDDAARA